MKLEQPTGLSRTMAFRSGVPTSEYMAETQSSTVITAQIPAVPAAPNYGVLLPDGSIWYPGSKKRLPAPLPLRVAVWTLAFLVILAAAGDFVIRDHPTWVDPLRRMVPASAGTLNLNTNLPASSKNHGGQTASSGLSVTQMKPQPSGLPQYTTAYAIRGTSAYQIVLKASETTWVVAYNLSNGTDSGTPLYAGDVQAGQTAKIAASGPVDLEAAAAGATVTIVSGGKQIGTLATPPSAPWHYFLEPSGPKQ